MSRGPFTATLRAAVVLLVLASAGRSAFAQGEAESIQAFVERKEQWGALAGARFVIEGRVAFLSPQTIQFDRCDLVFRLPPGTPVLPRDTRVAEVTGKLVREGMRVSFDVESLRRRDSDVETLRSRRGRIDSTRPEAWFELADWAAGRGAFYEDSELKKRAEELREIGLTAESRRLKSDDAAGYLELARRAAAWNLDQGVGWKFTHDAVRIELTKARNDPMNNGGAVLAMVLKSLPGANTPLTPEDEPLRQAYDRNYAETYARADTDTRFKLHRALYIQILLALIDRDIDPEGKNGYAVAARISSQIPELETLAESHRKKELAWLKSRVTSLTRDEIVDFAKKLTDRKEDAESKQVRQDWLRSREPAARLAGTRGLTQLADDYIALLNDEKTAITLYEAAWVSNPQSPEVTDWLTKRGLVVDGNRWVPAKMVAQPTEDRFAQAIQEGQVLPGMTGEQARAALGTRPSSIMRQASLGQVTELWIYRTEGLVVTLSRKTGNSESHVEKVASLPDEAP
ncbi:hypothetical protein Pan44_14710 [Caulifigura coniformis]|uniref:Uncharacterized protein n=1 Tax=Caulifigura coniformis TaxID=2527983 RepID=A0A517SBG7_9PLAN|nr:hypothetical protein [Caulifigura coniformis]QDT53454.1 hypothetical protein Pan44_14710 [Caulifigura coniformis]